MGLANSKCALSLLAAAALVCQDAPQVPTPEMPASSTSANQPPQDNGATYFASSIECVGDLNRDGRDDLAVSAPEAWSPNGRTGQVLILSGTDGQILRELHGDTGEKRFGWSVSAVRSTR